MIYRTACQVFLVLAVVGLIGWIYSKFAGSIMHVGQDGFLLVTTTALTFAIALALYQIAFEPKK